MDMIAFTSGINCLEVGYELTVKQLLKLSSDWFVRWFRMIVPLYSYLIIKHLQKVLSTYINMFHETQTWDIKTLKIHMHQHSVLPLVKNSFYLT